MTTFHLVRHAEKNGTDVLAGRTPGVPLTAHGRSQAAQLPALIGSVPITRVISSPIERARETAAPIADAFGCEIELAQAVTEMDLGAWTGSTPAQLTGSPAWEKFNRFRSATPAPDGETMLAVQARVVGALLGWRAEAPDAHVVVVSHAEPIRAALLWALGMPLDHFWRLEVSLASISTVELGEELPRVTRLNLVAPTSRASEFLWAECPDSAGLSVTARATAE